MPSRGTGAGIWYLIEPTDDPDTLFVTHPYDIPECWEEELYVQVRQRLGPFTLEYPPQAGCVDSIQVICRMSTN